METATKKVTIGIFNHVPTYIDGEKRIKWEKVGERVTAMYHFAAHPDSIEINGVKYRVEDNREWAIKVLKTKVKAIDGAKGLIKLFMSEQLDHWELRIIENCKPMK